MNKKFEFVAYIGEAFTIEWYVDDKNQSEALEYYNSLNASERIQLLKLFKRMGDVGEIKDKTKFRYEGDKIYAFKPQPDRFLCFFNEGKKIVVTNGFRKKQQKLPKKEKENALDKRNTYINRVNSGDYYE
jgi:phage-related protein